MTPPQLPTRFRPFAKESISEGDDEHILLTVKLHCPRCQGIRFILYWQHLRQMGRIIETSPVWIACSACRYHALLFDGNCDGINGLADEGPPEIPQCQVLPWNSAREPAYGVEVTVQYDIDPDQPDARSQIVPDGYDWLTIAAVWSDGSVEAAIDFETAYRLRAPRAPTALRTKTPSPPVPPSHRSSTAPFSTPPRQMPRMRNRAHLITIDVQRPPASVRTPPPGRPR